MIRDFRSRQFAAFLVSGGVAALVNLASRVVYDQWVDFWLAVILAYGTGMVTAFLLARTFVFPGATTSTRQSAAYFVLVNLLGLAQTWAVSMALANAVLPALGVTRHVPEIAHLIGVMVPAFTSYLGHKYLSFR